MSRRDLEDLFRQRLDAVKKEHASNLDTDFYENPFRPLKRRFVIAHAPRVGSHLLCEGLRPYGAAVEEIFEEPRIRNVSLKRGFSSVQEYCEWVLARHAIGGVFGVSGGVKVFAPLEMAGEIPAFVPDWRIVYVKRLDIVGQAVSEMMALATRAYKSSTTPTRVLADQDYDGREISRLIDWSLAINASWEGAFSYYGVQPLRMLYEDLANDPVGLAAQAAAHLDIDGPPITQERLLSPPLKKQATALNLAWAARFREENRAFCETREAGFFQPY